ncbi:hypothetical protein G9A89_015666 [Geosiphon pyriformis]|nr:hypothetical protein G9A89_015666 [Geosiphon pyriformis]
MAILIEINKKIEYYIQQRYPITYTNKGKGKLQTSAVTFQRIQLSTWKKTRLELLTNSLYHYTLGSIINISSASVFISNTKTLLAWIPFQSKQSKADLLRTYTNSWEITE